jgi:hypothetical protein
MMSASLTTLDRDVGALGWPDGREFFPAPEVGLGFPGLREDEPG